MIGEQSIFSSVLIRVVAVLFLYLIPCVLSSLDLYNVISFIATADFAFEKMKVLANLRKYEDKSMNTVNRVDGVIAVFWELTQR